MIKPIRYDDIFGYDDAHRPCAVQLHGNVFAFGYEFCDTYKSLHANGYPVAHRLFTDGDAFLFIYSPASKKAELWKGPWNEDEPNIYSIVNPTRNGVVNQVFESFDALKDFAASDMTALGVDPAASL